MIQSFPKETETNEYKKYVKQNLPNKKTSSLFLTNVRSVLCQNCEYSNDTF